MADNRLGQKATEAEDRAAKQALTLALTDRETVKRMSSSGEKAQRDRPNAMQRHREEEAEAAHQAEAARQAGESGSRT